MIASALRFNFGKVSLTLLAAVAVPPLVPAQDGSSAFSAVSTPTPRPANEIIAVVDPSIVFVDNFTGWGTALAWGGVVVGGWPQHIRSEIADLLFSREKGLGLNVVRYNIGAGPNPDPTPLRPGGDVPGFLPAKDAWDWSADANQRWMLQAAKERGADTFLAFSDSPPGWMTISGSTAGAVDGGNNLSPAMEAAFAEYLAETVLHFKKEWGIAFDALAPMNEPNSNWWEKGGRQEGCAFDPQAQERIIARVAESLKARGLTDVLIAAPDTFDAAELLKDWRSYSEATRKSIGLLSTHAYGANASDQEGIARVAAKRGVPIWMTEFGAGPGPNDLGSMGPAIAVSERIAGDLRWLRPQAWILWDGIECDEENESNGILWGAITAKYLDGSFDYKATRQYYGYGNYTRFIKPGSRIIESGETPTVAAISPDGASLILVAHNNRKTDRGVAFDLSSFDLPSGQISANAVRTSTGESLAAIASVPMDGSVLRVVLSGSSITSFTIPIISCEARPNLR